MTAEQQRQYRLAHPERVREARRRYDREHRDQINERRRLWKQTPQGSTYGGDAVNDPTICGYLHGEFCTKPTGHKMPKAINPATAGWDAPAGTFDGSGYRRPSRGERPGQLREPQP